MQPGFAGLVSPPSTYKHDDNLESCRPQSQPFSKLKLPPPRFTIAYYRPAVIPLHDINARTLRCPPNHILAAGSCGFRDPKHVVNAFSSFRWCIYTYSLCDFERQLSLPSQTLYNSFPCAAEFSYQFSQLKERCRVRLVSSSKICRTDLSLTADISADHDIVLCHGFLGMGGLPTGRLGYFNGVEKDLKDRGCRVYAPWVSMVATIDHRAEQLHKKIDTYLRDTYGSSKDRPVHLICQPFPHFAYNS